MYEFTSIKKEEHYNFKNIEIKTRKNEIKINFIDDGFASELFLYLRCISNDDKIKIDSLFLTFNDLSTKYEIKERIWKFKLLEMDYSTFIAWFMEKSSILSIGSDNNYDVSLTGLEIKLDNSINVDSKPTEWGVQEILNQIKWRKLMY